MSIVPQGDAQQPVLMVGLTGGIATGKSTVAGMFRELGIPVVDADRLVHELLGPGGRGVDPVRERFGEAVLKGDGSVDRPRLASLVYDDEDSRKDLEALLHPMVIGESRMRLEQLAARERSALVIYDAALLVETGRHEEFHRLVVVATNREVQLSRLMERDGLDAAAAGARIRSQMPVEKKTALADYPIENSGPWHATRGRVVEVHRRLLEDAELLRRGHALPDRR